MDGDADSTLHSDAAMEAERTRERIADAVETFHDFEVLAGPYRIEVW